MYKGNHLQGSNSLTPTKAAKWRVVEREARQTVVEDVDLKDEEVEPRNKVEAEILLRTRMNGSGSLARRSSPDAL